MKTVFLGRSRRRRLAIGFIGAAATASTLFITSAPTAQAAAPAALAVSGLSPAAAGSAQTVKVTSTLNGKPNANYRGRVVLTSTDSKAVLPAPYTFTAKDKGVRSFPVTLKTSGSQTVTATDSVSGTITGSQTVTVSPGPAGTFALSGLAAVTSGASQSMTLTVRDAFDNVATGYRGTVLFTSSDSQATLPANYAFNAADAGSRSFSVTLKSTGQQSVSVADQANSSLSSSQTVAISGGAAVALNMTTDPVMGQFEGSSVTTAGETFKVILTAIDANGNRATGYTGTVKLASTDGRTLLPPPGLPGAGTAQFSAADSGRITLSGIAFFTKKIYGDRASLTAVDATNSGISGALTFQVRPGPVNRYSPCSQPLSSASSYTQVNAPIGVNDALGLSFTALDAYGNDATVFQRNFPLGSLAPGYEAVSTVTTSDGQAANISNVRFTGSTFVATSGLALITLRTAGQQSVTITDPNNASLTRTCSYTVLGPQAYTGTIEVADPNTTGNTTVWLPATTYVPPNDSGVTVLNPIGPYVDRAIGSSGSLVALGTIAPAAGALMWDLDPAVLPPATTTCTTGSPCSVNGPLQIAYTIRDDYGNTSAGIITVKPWNAVIPRGNIIFASNQILLSGGGTLPLDTALLGTIVGTSPGSATVAYGNGMGLTIATPSTTGLVVGAVVTTRVQKPVDVDGTALPCTSEPGVNCFPASWATVTITPGNTTSSGPPTPLPAGTGLTTIAGDACGVLYDNGTACPTVKLSDNFLPPPTGVGPPPDGDVGSSYSYWYFGIASLPEDLVTFSYTGTLPPGMTLSLGGHLSGTPELPGLFTFTVKPTGTVSGATSLGVTHTVRICGAC